MSLLLRRICQLEEPPANETTEPLTFTVCKVELRSKAIVSQSRFRRTRFMPVVNNNRQNRKKATCNKIRENEWQLSKRDYKKALFMDMKSQIESICYIRSLIKPLIKFLAFCGYDTLRHLECRCM